MSQLAVFIDFENVALWAEQEFLDFEITTIMEFLQGRGPVVIKRAYGDWSRFSRYRDQLLNNSVDLIQMYSLRSAKNRADIRMAMDALETAITRDKIETFVIVSGDSDFGPLVSKLREYGRYTLGVGPRDVTHPLLVKACDEFVYLETVLGESPEIAAERSQGDQEAARALLRKALSVHSQRVEIPISATRLKQTMMQIDPAFNEVHFGYNQFKTWLEDYSDAVQLFTKGLELYVAPMEFDPPAEFALTPFKTTNRNRYPQPIQIPRDIEQQYTQIFSRLKMTATDFNTRRDVLRDIYRELTAHPGERTTDELLEILREQYEKQGLIRSKTTLRQIWQMGFRQRAYDYKGEYASVHVPVWLSDHVDSEADFVKIAESGFVFAVIHAGLRVNKSNLANILIGDSAQTDYIDTLLSDLEARNLVERDGDRYVMAGQDSMPLMEEEALLPIIKDIEELDIPDNQEVSPAAARNMARTAMVQRSQDFAAAAHNSLLACKIQWEAVASNMDGASLEDLRWYMASYASVKAGERSQVHRDYAGSRPYYLAFFSLVTEDDPLWTRMRGLVNPMLSYFWANIGREYGVTVAGKQTPAQTAMFAATHSNKDLRYQWAETTQALARVNPMLVSRVANQLRLTRTDSPDYERVARQLETMLNQ